MVKIILKPGIRRMSGTLGDWTFRWTHGRQTIMKTPDLSKVKWSKAQKAHRQRFRQAIAYARRAMADPSIRAHYQKVAKKAGRQPFRVAVSDFFAGKNLLKKPPPAPRELPD
jgi:hypothetical protein